MVNFQSSAGTTPRTPLLYKIMHAFTACIRVTCICFSPCIVSLFSSKRPQYVIINRVLWFLLGLTVSAVLYQLFLVDMGLNVGSTYALALLMTSCISLGVIVSRQVSTRHFLVA
uniref:Uncharacterized protein n=1 Tax=Cacopsylla melanoneura TaxID=428564 RepID=A0A8D8ZEG9_9HEMI